MTLIAKTAGFVQLPSSANAANPVYEAILSGSGSPEYLGPRPALRFESSRTPNAAISDALAGARLANVGPKNYLLRALFEGLASGLGLKDSFERVAESRVEESYPEESEDGAREVWEDQVQLEHWVRVVRSLALRTTAIQRRLAVSTGELQADDNSVVYDAEIDALLEERLSGDNHVARRASEGYASVALDDAGHMVEYRPDGTSVTLDW